MTKDADGNFTSYAYDSLRIGLARAGVGLQRDHLLVERLYV